LKFIIVLTVCSSVYQECLPPVYHKQHFDTHYDCATYGYNLAKDMMAEMGQKFVNEDKVIIGFKCKTISDI